VRALTVHDQKTVEVRDLSAQFYLTEEDVGQNRAEACKEKLQELNNAVEVSASSAQLTPEYLEQFQVCRGRCAASMQHSAQECRVQTHQQLNIVCAHQKELFFMHACRWWC